VARFDSDVISDNDMIPHTRSVQISQLSQDAAHVPLTSRAVFSRVPASNLKQVMFSGMQHTVNCDSNSVNNVINMFNLNRICCHCC